jgi:two-component sensor histidine kinase
MADPQELMMIHEASNIYQSRWELLHVAEVLHRVANDYTRAVSLASLMASKASTDEARTALNEVANHLQIIAMTHKVLRPPSVDELVDFTEAVARLCRAMAEASDLRRREINLLLKFDRSILLSSWRCWHANLIIAELINNACRDAFGSKPGRITIMISESDGRVVCVVGDNGCGPKAPSVGLGTQLIGALVGELDGFVERRFTRFASTVTVSFSKDNAIASTRLVHPHLPGGFRMKPISRRGKRTDVQDAVHFHPVAAKHRQTIRDSLNRASAEP